MQVNVITRKEGQHIAVVLRTASNDNTEKPPTRFLTLVCNHDCNKLTMHEPACIYNSKAQRKINVLSPFPDFNSIFL